jgi:hypothetical protein
MQEAGVSDDYPEVEQWGVEGPPMPDQRDPEAVAFDYIDAVAQGRIEDAWGLATERFRFRQARHWVWARRFQLHDEGWDVEDLVRELATEGPGHPVWAGLARVQRNGARRTGFPDRTGWSSVGAPEPIGPALEKVSFARTDAPEVPSLRLLLEFHQGRWAVGGLEMHPTG